ncbi:ArnT family glycosyltransferase [Candidatus Marimicrobium litorale]|uniref:Glycosyltransferase RgtA/B/C/D-like domain-containing protein n=1 Tax=Candidatus Marimicrobium litorale TaxID=2518991 RepID=A0ABT3TB15_9GAMM|nr:hypothetical protein [Candidatus Marimicrobium litorale]MCX2978662.1 hypothetical protein [Candidatus Marimicrobium litorale]
MATDRSVHFRNTFIAVSLSLLMAAFLSMNISSLQWPFGIVDSPIVLAHAIKYSPLEYFTTPVKYQFLTLNNLTPWVTLSWDFDYHFFGVDAIGYRFHHLVSGAVLLILIYITLYRVSGSKLNAAIFSFAFATLPSTLAISDDLINRHYLEGMSFCLLSFLFAHQYGRSPRASWLALSVFFYGISVTTKEVYIPLPGILFFVFVGTVGRRIVLILPYALVLSLYILWRIYMLEGPGGYSSPTSLSEMIPSSSLFIFFAQRVTTSFSSNPQISLVIFIVFLVLLLKSAGKMSLSTKLGSLVGLISLLVPFLGVVNLLAIGYFANRWMFTPSVAFLIFFSYLTKLNNSKYLNGFVLILLLFSSLAAWDTRLKQDDLPYHAGKGKVYEYILAPNSETYMYRSYSHLVARGVSTWRYISFMRNGVWGPLVISAPGQLEYHDTVGKTPLYPRGKKSADEFTSHEEIEKIDLLDDVSFQPSDGMMTFHFDNMLRNSSCFIYIFGENNGFLFDTDKCDQWRISARELAYLLQMAGYQLSDVSIALWEKDTDTNRFSKEYRISDVFDLDLLQGISGTPAP